MGRIIKLQRLYKIATPIAVSIILPSEKIVFGIIAKMVKMAVNATRIPKKLKPRDRRKLYLPFIFRGAYPLINPANARPG